MLVVRVVGYPRSGNTWLARLVGTTLGGTVYGPVLGQRGSLASDVQGNGDVAVVQSHSYMDGTQPRAANDGVPQEWLSTDKVLLVLRDPRDVAVSCRHFFEMHSMQDAVRRVGHPGGVFFPGFPSWQDYNTGWLEQNELPMAVVVYRDLRAHPAATVHAALHKLGLPFAPEKLAAAIAYHDFGAQRARVQAGAPMPHGTAAQLRHLRSGRQGDWRQAFTRRAAQMANHLWAEWLTLYGWEDDPNWWRKVKDNV